MRFEHEGTPVRVEERMALAPLTFLPASSPRAPPASVVLTLWLSMIAADGLASRPTRSRSAISSAWFIRSKRPSSRRLAELEAEAEGAEQALQTLDKALALADETGEHWTDAYLHRLRGEILLRRDPANTGRGSIPYRHRRRAAAEGAEL